MQRHGSLSALAVKRVTSRREQKQFVSFPRKLYEGDPNWVPPLLMEHRRLLGYHRHPFYDDAEIQTFLATRKGQVCGRIAAIVNHAHNRRTDEKCGFFGFFETVNDQRVADALFDAAGAWLRDRGMQTIRGPANPSLNYEIGLLIDGFHSPPTFGMTYNKPYYEKLFEAWGFTKVQDMFAFFGHIDLLSKLDNKLWFIGTEAKERFNVTIRPLNHARFGDEVEMFLRLYNTSLPGTWGFVPFSPSEIKAVGAGLKHLIVPELAIVAEVNGEPIGACLGLLDFNPRIKRINGRLFPFGFLHLIRNKRAIKKMRVVSMNVLPEYQRWGLGVVLLCAIIESLQKWGIQEVEYSYVLESNTLSRGSLEKGGAKRDKTYRMYDRDLPA